MALYRITALRLNTAGQQCKCSYGKSANWLCTFGGCGGSRGQAPDIQPASRSVHRGVVLPGLARGWMQEPFPAHTILVYSMPQADEAVSGLPVGTLRGLVVLCQGWLLSRPLAGGVRAPPHRRPQRIFGGRDPYASERPSVPRAPRWSWVETRSFGCAKKRGCAFGCGLASVPVGGEMADLRRRPHPWHPRVVYSELCTTQGNLTV
uniref:Uncharacterized protein n=1 Tax=Eutreptiella gymnastica TaxID=73025 RepID=A0A7S4G3G8_9EUGL